MGLLLPFWTIWYLIFSIDVYCLQGFHGKFNFWQWKERIPQGKSGEGERREGLAKLKDFNLNFKNPLVIPKMWNYQRHKDLTQGKQVNICLAFIPSSVFKIVMSVLSLKKDITLTFWKPGMVIFALSNVLRWLNTNLHEIVSGFN